MITKIGDTRMGMNKEWSTRVGIITKIGDIRME